MSSALNLTKSCTKGVRKRTFGCVVLGSKYDQRIDADTRARQYRRQGGTNFSCRGLVLPSSSSSSSEIKTVYCERRWNTILVLDLAGESTPPPGPHPNVPSFPPPLLLLRCYASFTCCARKILAKQWANLAVGLDLESLHKTELTADNVLAPAFDLAIQKRLEQNVACSHPLDPKSTRAPGYARVSLQSNNAPPKVYPKVQPQPNHVAGSFLEDTPNHASL